jgi:D-sedoheptulose 7-phosphate isomerase
MIEFCLKEHIEVAQKMEDVIPKIEEAALLCLNALKRGGKILLCGNGGSAADAQHIAAELSGRFKKERKALAGISLSTDTSALTAISNDYGYEYVFSRQIEAIGKRGDALIVISTSGESKNLLKAIESAREAEINTIALLGKGGGVMRGESDIDIIIPSQNTPRIQEMHIMAGHMICNVIESSFVS